MREQTNVFDDLPLDELRRLDELCIRFESAWAANRPPVLEDYLTQVESTSRDALLKELLYLDIEQRRGHGDTPAREEFLLRFGNDAKIVNQVWQRLEQNGQADINQDMQHAAGKIDPPAEADSQQFYREDTLNMRCGRVRHISQISLWDDQCEAHDRIVKPASSEMPNVDELGERYQLHGEIARGGMGAIIKGRDVDLGRELAIKVLLESHKDKPQVLQRFVEEAQIGGQLQHPGIVPVYELGQFRDQRPFFSMKLVKGKTLTALLAERPNPQHDRGRFFGIFEQVCQTMAYAHSKGVIHRDLKPSNIMVGAFGEVQVMDWGLAKVLEQGGIADEKKAKTKLQADTIIRTVRSEGSDTPSVAGSETCMGSVMGTPAYMSPEQALGEIDILDERCDVFGLGAILCEILTGQPPYAGEDSRQVHRMATRGQLDDAWQRLDACGADDELVTLAKLCLAAEMKDRPRAAGGVATQMTDYLASVERRLHEAEVQRARAESKTEEEIKRRRVARALVASLSAASLLLVLLTGGVAFTAFYFRNQQQIQRALAEEKGLLAIKNGDLAKKNGDLAKSNGDLAKNNEQLFKEKEAEAEAAVAAREAAELARIDVEYQRAEAMESLYLAKMSLVNDGLRNPSSYGQLAKTIQQIREFRTWQDPRGWEWFYTQSLMHQETMALHGHQIDVLAVAWSPNGRWLASAGFDRTILIWDAQTGRQARMLPAPKGISFLVWSPDGERLASANLDNTAVVWNPHTGQRVLSLTRHTERVNAVAWDPGGRRLATSSHDKTIRIWDASNGEELLRFQTPLPVTSLAWSPDGTRLASASYDHLVNIWDPSKGESKVTCRGHHDAVTSVAWCPTGQQLVSGSDDKTIKVWDADSGKLVLDLAAHLEKVNSVAWSPDGRRLVSGSDDKTIRVWDSVSGRETLTLGGHSGTVNAVGWSPDGQQLVSAGGGWNGVVKIWDAEPVLPRRRLLTHAGGIHAVAWSPSGHQLASCGADHAVRIWDADRLRSVAVLQGHDQEVTAVAWSPNGKRIASGDSGGEIILWDAMTFQQEEEPLGRHAESIQRIQWSPDSRLLTSSSSGPHLDYTTVLGVTKIWSLPDRKLLRSHDATTGSLSPDGTQLAVSERYKIKLFEVSGGELIREWPTSVEHHQNLSWSPDGQNLAADDSAAIITFQTIKGMLVSSFEGNTGQVTAFAWSPDGSRMASASADKKILIFADGQPVITLRDHEATVNSLAWSPHGTQLASGDGQGVMRVWDARKGLRREQPPALRPSLDARLATQPDDVEALQMRAVTFARSRQWNEAATDFQRIAELQGERAPSFFSTGWWVADKYAETRKPSLRNPLLSTVPPAVDPFELDDSVETYMTAGRPRWYASDQDPNGYIPWQKGYHYTMARLFARQECAVMWSLEGSLPNAWLNGRWLGPANVPLQLSPGWNTLVLQLTALGQREFPGFSSVAREAVVTQGERPAQPLRLRLSSDPETVAAAYRVRANWYGMRHQWVPAAAYLLRAFELNPDQQSEMTWLQLAALLIENRDLEVYRRYLPLMISQFDGEQDNPFVLQRVATACLVPPISDSRPQEGDLKKAIAMADRAVRIGPEFAWFQFGKGLAELRAARFQNAVEWLDRCLPTAGQNDSRRLDPNLIPMVCFADAVANLQLGKPERAQELFEMGSAAIGDGADYRLRWWEWPHVHVLHSEAETLMNGSPPAEALERVKRGLAYAKLGRHERADEEFAAAISNAPDDPVVLIYYARGLAELHRNEPADQTLVKLEVRLTSPGIAIRGAETWNTYAEVLSLRGRHEEAIQAFHTALDLQKLVVIKAPTSAESIIELGELNSKLAAGLEAAGRDAEAKQVAGELDLFLIAHGIATPEVAAVRLPAPAEAREMPNEEALAAVDQLLGSLGEVAESTDPVRVDLAARAYVRRAELLRQVEREAEAMESLAAAHRLYEQLLASRPQHEEWATQLATVALHQTNWTLLTPLDMVSQGGATLTRLPDESILASGENPSDDVYTITAKMMVQGITAIRLETIPDPSFADGGSGRHPWDGNFVLSEFRIDFVPPDVAVTPVQIRRSYADYSLDRQRIELAVDGKADTHWSVSRQHSKPHFAIFETASSLGEGAETTLLITIDCRHSQLKQHAIGRFRLSVTSDPISIPQTSD